MLALALPAVTSAASQGPAQSVAAARRLIPPGACVVTDTVSATIAAGRFDADSPGCPKLVDSVGTLIATTDGEDLSGTPSLLAANTRVWQAAFERAQYVWLIGTRGYTGHRIIWTPALDQYFLRHFRLRAFRTPFGGRGDVPGGGLYIRTLSARAHRAAGGTPGGSLGGWPRSR